jgi:hypothetical protein
LQCFFEKAKSSAFFYEPLVSILVNFIIRYPADFIGQQSVGRLCVFISFDERVDISLLISFGDMSVIVVIAINRTDSDFPLGLIGNVRNRIAIVEVRALKIFLQPYLAC